MYINKSVPHDDLSEGRKGFGIEIHRNFFDTKRFSLLVGVEYNLLTQYYRYIRFGSLTATEQTIQVSYFGFASSVRLNTKLAALDFGVAYSGAIKNSPIEVYPGGRSEKSRFGFLTGLRFGAAFKIPNDNSRILVKIGYKYNTNSVTGKNFKSYSSTIKFGFAYVLFGKPRAIKE